MIVPFEGKTVTVDIPLCPTCSREMTPWVNFMSTGWDPVNATDVLVYSLGLRLWACSSFECRRVRVTYSRLKVT